MRSRGKRWGCGSCARRAAGGNQNETTNHLVGAFMSRTNIIEGVIKTAEDCGLVSRKLHGGFYSPSDMQQCARDFGAACGHGALAAACSVPVRLAMSFFQCAEER